jgi:hypothetical protein
MIHAAEPKWSEGRRHEAEVMKKTEASFKVGPRLKH